MFLSCSLCTGKPGPGKQSGTDVHYLVPAAVGPARTRRRRADSDSEPAGGGTFSGSGAMEPPPPRLLLLLLLVASRIGKLLSSLC